MDSERKSFNAYLLPELLPKPEAIILWQNPTTPEAVDNPRGGLAWLKKYYDYHREKLFGYGFSTWKEINDYGLALIKSKINIKLSPKLIFDALCGIVKIEPFAGIDLILPKMLCPILPGLSSREDLGRTYVVDYKFKSSTKLSSGEVVDLGSEIDLVGIVSLNLSTNLRSYEVATVQQLLKVLNPEMVTWADSILTKTESEKDYLLENFPSGTPIYVSKKFHPEFTHLQRRLTPDITTDSGIVETVVVNSAFHTLEGEYVVTADIPGETNRALLRPFEIRKFTPKLSTSIKDGIKDIIDHTLPRTVKKSYFEVNKGPPLIKGMDRNDPLWPFGKTEAIPLSIADFSADQSHSVVLWMNRIVDSEIWDEALKTGELRIVLTKSLDFHPSKNGKLLKYWKRLGSSLTLDLPTVEVGIDDFMSLVPVKDPNKIRNQELALEFAITECRKLSSDGAVVNQGSSAVLESFGNTHLVFTLKMDPWYLLLFKNEKYLDTQIEALAEELTSVPKIHLHHKLLARKWFERQAKEELEKVPVPKQKSSSQKMTKEQIDDAILGEDFILKITQDPGSRAAWDYALDYAMAHNLILTIAKKNGSVYPVLDLISIEESNLGAGKTLASLAEHWKHAFNVSSLRYLTKEAYLSGSFGKSSKEAGATLLEEKLSESPQQIPDGVKNLLGWSVTLSSVAGEALVITVVKYLGVRPSNLEAYKEYKEAHWEVAYSDGQPNKDLTQHVLLHIIKVKPPVTSLEKENSANTPKAQGLILNIKDFPVSPISWLKALTYADENKLIISGIRNDQTLQETSFDPSAAKLSFKTLPLVTLSQQIASSVSDYNLSNIRFQKA